ncbi:uncharacterized protein JCM6883_003477 [Sporobolomyces salmoneus]|uniref:uncharacterized protein n=1 Tax=Sporobolomyces salmoneus TaxID=183962 RepID=UPI0031768152
MPLTTNSAQSMIPPSRHGLSQLSNRPILSIISISLLLRFTTTLLLLFSHRFLPSFAADATKLSSPLFPSYWEAFVRWDTVYFLEIAKDGYSREQRFAFSPGLPAIFRFGGELLRRVRGAEEVSFEDMVLVGIVSTTLATAGAAILLLSLHLFRSREYSLITSTLFLLAPARAVLHAVPYTEPFSALFTFAGMLTFIQHRDLLSSIMFACGATFRAQGAVMGLGFFGWRWILQRPFAANRLSLKRLVQGIVVTSFLSLISASPFLVFQAHAYREHCSSLTSLRPWCSSTFGFSYGWIQNLLDIDADTNVGPFRYWTLLQLPNFLLASPVLLLSFSASYSYYSSQPRFVLARTLPFLFSPSSPPPEQQRLFLSPALMPFIHLHTATTLLLLVSSHVQIVLRLCIVDPVVWWYATDLVLARAREGEGDRRRRWGERWIWYTIVWGTISIVLWALFLPPA